MSQSNPRNRAAEPIELLNPDEVLEWTSKRCEVSEKTLWSTRSLFSARPLGIRAKYADNWADSVPQLVDNLAALVAEKKRQELQFNLLQIAISDFEGRIHRLESLKARIIPVDTFAPEPYNLLKTILVSVHCVEGGFNAGWFDANIHSSGDNEEEATSNLKSLILDFFDSFSNKPAEQLGPEPTRQLALLKEYIQKRP